MADSTKASAGSTAGTVMHLRAAARKRSSPSVAMTIGAALWAR